MEGVTLAYEEGKGRNLDVLFQETMPDEVGALRKLKTMHVDEAVEESVARLVQPSSL